MAIAVKVDILVALKMAVISKPRKKLIKPLVTEVSLPLRWMITLASVTDLQFRRLSIASNVLRISKL